MIHDYISAIKFLLARPPTTRNFVLSPLVIKELIFFNPILYYRNHVAILTFQCLILAKGINHAILKDGRDLTDHG